MKRPKDPMAEDARARYGEGDTVHRNHSRKLPTDVQRPTSNTRVNRVASF
jgi:hypothetical protein